MIYTTTLEELNNKNKTIRKCADTNERDDAHRINDTRARGDSLPGK